MYDNWSTYSLLSPTGILHLNHFKQSGRVSSSILDSCTPEPYPSILSLNIAFNLHWVIIVFIFQGSRFILTFYKYYNKFFIKNQILNTAYFRFLCIILRTQMTSHISHRAGGSLAEESILSRSAHWGRANRWYKMSDLNGSATSQKWSATFTPHPVYISFAIRLSRAEIDDATYLKFISLGTDYHRAD